MINQHSLPLSAMGRKQMDECLIDDECILFSTISGGNSFVFSEIGGNIVWRVMLGKKEKMADILRGKSENI